jgi:multiple sugar transport system substrate-binding protein
MVAAGIPPDLVRTWNAKKLGASGLLQDLTSRFQKLPAAVRNDFWPVLLDDLSYEGRLYALPLGTVCSMYYYNKQLFDEKGVPAPNPNWSWEREGISELKKLSVDLNGDGVPDQWGLGAVDGGAGNELYPFIYSAGGGPLFNEDGRKFLGNNPATRDALQFLQDLAQVHRVMNPIVGGWGEFAQQRAASLLWGSFMAGYFPAYENLDWDFALRPTFHGNRASNVWAETPYGISSGAKRADLAWRALEYIASVEGQQLSIKLGWAIPPARRSVTVGAFLQHFSDKEVQVVAEMLSLPLNQPLPRQAPSGWQTSIWWPSVVVPVYRGEKAPGQAIDEVAPRIAALAESQ